MKAAATPAAQAVTANRLHDGVVVYRSGNGIWSTRIGDSEIAGDAAAAARLLAAAEKDATDRLVVGPYLIEVDLAGGGIRPIGVRETIRATGPSVETKVA